MKAVYKELIDNSLSATLSAIEIYNKPDFKYRDETFVVLIINAWELLLKAKVLKDNNHRKEALYVKDGSRYKRSRTGNYLTLEIRGLLTKTGVNEVVRDNLDSLLELRDTAIHFYNKDTIAYTIFSLGAACLQNYQKYMKEWFATDLTQYNFYILPLGFKYSFKNFDMIDVNKEAEVVKNLLTQIVARQSTGNAESNGFYLVADIKAEVVSAKKMADEAHLKIAIDQSADAKGIIRNQNLTDRYPYTATQVWHEVHEVLPGLKQNAFYQFIKEKNLKNNPKYSAYNFRNKTHEQEYKATGKVATATPSIYNVDAVTYILENIES